MKSKYKVIKDLPTGVRTKIKDSYEGEIKVIFEVVEPFKNKI